MSRCFKEEIISSKKSSTGNEIISYSVGNRRALKEISNGCGVHNKQEYTKRAIDRRTNGWFVHDNNSEIENKTVSTKSKNKITNEITCVVKKSDRHSSLVLKKNTRRKTIDSKYAVRRSSDFFHQVEENISLKLSQCSLKELKEKQCMKNEENTESHRRDEVEQKRVRCKEEDENDIEDPYKKYEGNLFLCTTYVKHIYNHLLNLEDQFTIKLDFMKSLHVTPRVRAVLVDWMIDVQLLFKLSNESLHLSIYLVDCYLASHKSTIKEDLQVLAIACILIAGKYDLVHPPHLEDLLKATEYTIRKCDVLRMEIKVLKSVGFRLNKPPITCFLRRYGIIADIDKIHHCCSKFFVDACLLNHLICLQKSSLIAAAATFLSLSIKTGTVTPSLWDSNLTKHSKYGINEILPLVRFLAPFVIDLPDKYYSTAIMEKYSMSQFENVKEKIYNPANLEIIKKICFNFRHSQTNAQKKQKDIMR